MTEIEIAQAVPLVSIPDVELAAAGRWRASTGETTFTAEDLAEAVAAMDCPGIRNPVLKLGHQEEDSGNGIRWDGEPAVGYITNMRLSDNGTKIVGDYAGVPSWLADVMASAYPDRSVELYRPWRCQIGHYHRAVITAVALLGVMPPGIGVLRSLQDVQAIFTTTGAHTATHTEAHTDLVVLARGEARPARVGDSSESITVQLSPSRPGRRVMLDFNPGQLRDTKGRWTDGAGGMTDAQLLKAKPWELNRTAVFGDEAELASWRLLESYRAEEATVTPELTKLAKDSGARMEGLDFRLKTQESLARKLEQKSATKGLTPSQYSKKIGDALRYTMVMKDDNYGETAQKVIDQFRSEGYVVEVENTWAEGASYKGINTNIKKDGLTFELQLHSDGSIHTKHENWGLYAVARNTKASPEDRAKATEQMLKNSAALAHPEGAEKVK